MNNIEKDRIAEAQRHCQTYHGSNPQFGVKSFVNAAGDTKSMEPRHPNGLTQMANVNLACAQMLTDAIDRNTHMLEKLYKKLP